MGREGALRLVFAMGFLLFALFITGVAVFVTQTTDAQSSEITPMQEGETAMIMASISESLGPPLPLTLNLVREGSTANRNEDYTLRPSEVKIARGETMTVVNVPTLSLDQREASIYEGTGVTLTVSLDSALEGPLMVSLESMGSSTAETNDYTLAPLIAQIESGQMTATFRLDADQNQFYEIDEQLILVPIGRAPGLEEIMGEPIVVTIVDDETQPILELDRIYDIKESDAAFPNHYIPVRLIGDPLETDLSYDLAFGGSAIMGIDYLHRVGLTEDVIRASEQFGGFVLRVGNDNSVGVDDPASVVISVTVDEASLYLVEQGFVKLGELTRSFFILDIDALPTLSLGPVVDVEDSSVERPGIVQQGSSSIFTVTLNLTLNAPLPATLTIIPTDTPGATIPAGFDDYRLSYLTDTGTTFADALEIPFTIPAYAREFTFALEAMDSMNVGHDRDKTLILELSADTETVDLDVTQRGVTIRDYNPAPILSVEDIDYSVNEGQTLTFTVEVVGAASYTQTLSLVPYLPQVRPLGTDQATDRDLSLFPTSVITIPADSDGDSPISRFEFTLTANEDNIYEGTESTTLNVVLRDDNGNQVDQDIRYVNIIDNDVVEVGFDSATYNVPENAGGVTITVNTSGRLAEGVNLSVEYVRGTASETEDYVSPLTREIPLLAGATRATLFVEIVNDDLYENADTFSVRLVEPEGGLPGVELVTGMTEATVTITNDDEIEIGFVEGMYTFLENQRRGTAQVRYSGSDISAGVEVVVYYSTTVEIGDSVDINDVSGTLVLGSNQRVYNINIPITDDNTFTSETERYTISLGTFDMNSGLTFRPDRVSTGLNVLTDDVLDFGFSMTEYEVNEASGTVELEVSVLKNRIGAGVRVVVSYSTTPGSATSSDLSDFEPVTGELILSSMSTVVTFAIPIVNDDIFEGSESFVVTLKKADGRDTLRLSPSEATVTILDEEDVVEVGFDSATYSVPENAGGVTITVNTSGRLAEDVNLSVEYVRGTASETEDYVSPLTREIPLSAGATRATLFVEIVNDDLYENADTFSVRLVEPEGGLPGVELVTGMTEATVTITNDDEIEIGFVEGMYTFLENQRRGTAQVRYSGSDISAGVEVLVYYSTTVEIGDSVDINDVSGTLVLSSNQRVYNINIPITDDNAFTSETERYRISLGTFDMNSGLTFRPDRDSASLNVLTDDVLDFGFSMTEYEVNEASGTVELEVSVLKNRIGAGVRVVVSYSTTPGSATSSDLSDFEPVTGELILSSMSTVVTFAIPIVNDDIFEGSESFVVTLKKADGRDTLRLSPSEATVTILDDELPPTLRLGPVGEITEGHSTTIEVSLTGVLEVPVRVSLAYGVSSTVSQGDYTLSEIDAEIAAGELTATFSLGADQNRFYEIDEQLILVPSGRAPGLEEITGEPVVVTIVDDETQPILELDRIYDIKESDAAFPNHYIPVRLIGDPLETDLSYDLAFGGSAIMGTDYLHRVGLTEDVIRAGEQLGGFILRVGNDNSVGVDDPASVVISVTVDEASLYLVEQGFVKLGELTRSFFILDIDALPTLSLGPIPDLDEGDSRIITASLNFALPSDLEVSLRVNQELSTVQEDSYRLSPRVSMIPAGARDVTFTLEALYDMAHYIMPERSPIHLALEVNADEQMVDIDLTGDGRRIVRVNDNDPLPTLSFDPIEDVTEGDDFTATVRLSHLLDVAVLTTFELILSAGTVEEEDFEVPTTLTVEIPAGDTTVDLIYGTRQDEVYEGPEILVIRPIGFIFANASITHLDGISGEITIIDEDPIPTISLDSLGQVREGDDLTVTVRLSGALEVSVTVELSPTNGNAESDDYTISPTRATILPGDREVEFTLTVHEDSTYEETETLRLKVKLGGEPAELFDSDILPARNIIIIDRDINERPTLSLDDGPTTINEGTSAEFTVQLNNIVEVPLVLSIAVSRVTGTDSAGDRDYRPLPDSVVIPAGSLSVTFTLEAIADMLYEGDEQLLLSLQLNPIGITINLGDLDREITIVDRDDPTIVSLRYDGALEIEEGQDISITIRLIPALDQDLTVGLERIGGDAVEGDDYQLPSLPILVPAGTSEFPVVISLLSDTDYEQTETIQFRLTLPPDTSVNLGTSSELSLMIVEQFIERGDEIETILDFSVAHSPTCVEEFGVCLQTSPGTYHKPLGVAIQDASARRGALPQLPGELQHLLDAPLLDIYFVDADGNLVSNLNRDVIITTSIPEAQVDSLGRIPVSYAVWHDGATEWESAPTTRQYNSDTAQYDFSTPSSRFSLFGLAYEVTTAEVVTATLRVLSATVAEGSSETLYVELSAATTEDVTVTLTVAGTASDGDDYQLLLSVPYVLTPGMTELAVGISTVIDGLYEGDETIEFVISTLSGPAVTGSVDRVTVTIIDNDGPPDPVVVGFDKVTYEVDESAGVVTLTVEVISGDLTEDVTLSYTTVEDSAMDPEDYAGGSVVSITTLSSLVTSVTFRITIVDDELPESTEQFFVDLASVGSLPAGVTLNPDTATVMIRDIPDDHCPPSCSPTVVIGFDPDMYTVNEGDGTVELTVKVLAGSLTRDVTLNYETMDGSATAGEDYTYKMDTIVLSSSVTEETIMVDITDDALLENAEMFTVVLSGTPVGVTLTPAIATVTISDDRVAPPPDDDMVEIGFESATYSVSEGAGTVALTVKVLNGSLGRAVTLNYETRDGTAIAGEDHTYKMDTIVLSSSVTEETIMVDITDDALLENAEMFTVVLSGAPVGVTLNPAIATVTISDDRVAPPPDDDMVEIGFESATYSVSEGAGTVALTVKVLNGSLGRAVTLNYETRDGTAIAGEDYTYKMDTIVLSSSVTEETIMVDITDDALLENAEMFTVVLSGAPVGVTLTPAIATVTISDDRVAPPPDDDMVEIGFESATYSVSEGAGTVALTVKVLNGSLGRAVTLNYETRDGTAIAGEDYTYKMDTIVLSSSVTEETIMVDITDDALLENAEMFTVVLSGAPVGVTLTPAIATVTISDDRVAPPPDDDMVEIGFESATYSVSEGAGTVALTVKVLNGSLGRAVTLNYETRDGTAIAGEDYTYKMDTIVLSSSVTEETIMVDITDDALLENAEMFTVVLSGAPVGVTLTPAIATVTISDDRVAPPPDDDMVEIGFESATYSVSEGAGTVALTVKVLNGSLGRAVTLNYETRDGTAIAGEDYTYKMDTIVLSSSVTEETIMVDITDDALLENAEMFTVVLSGAPVGVTLNPAIATVTISDDRVAPPPDDDMVEIGFESATYSVSEGAGTVALTVKVLNGSLGRAVTLNYETRDGTAIAGEDYTYKMDTIVLSSSVTEETIMVDITDDALLENAEMFTVVLSGAPVGVTLTPAIATVTISDDRVAPPPDDDMVEIGFESATYSVSEGAGTVALTVKVLNGSLGRAVTLNYETRDGTAIAGEDYTYKMDTIVLSSSVTEETIMVDITDDALLENAEMFTVVLSGAPVGVTLNPAIATVTISDDRVAPPPDDDMVEIGFEFATYSVSEGAGTVALTVKVLNGSLGRAVTLNYETRDGTAIAGEDYTYKMDTIVLSSSVTEETIMVDITDDALLENAEMFTVVLSGAPVGVTLNLDTTEVTIRGMAAAMINPGDMGLYCDSISATDPKACVRVNSMISTGPLALVIEYRSQADSIIGMGSLPDGTAVLPGAPVWDIYFEDANGNRVQTLSNTVEVEVTIPRDLVDDNMDADVEAGDVSIGVLHTGSVEWLTLSTSYNPVDSNYSFTASIDGFSFFNLIVPVKAEFRSTEMSLREGESIDLFIDLTVATSQDITVALNWIAGDAIEGVDYELSSLPITIKAGMRTGRVSFTSLYDFDSQSEMVEFELSASNGAVAGLMSRVMIRIVDNYDNDGLPPLSLNLTVPDVQEGDSGMVTVELSHALPEPTEVSVRVVGGMAEMNDYELPAGSVTIKAGETTAEFDLRAICDILPEGDETLVLEAMATTRLISLTSSQMEGMIQDISLDIDGVSELDEGDDADIRVRLSGDRCNPTTVSLTVIGGTAVASDYTLLPGSEIVIPAGSREARFRLVADRDREREADETLVLVASVVGLEGMMLTVTILDVDVDDGPGILPPTGGLALPVWLLGVLALVGVLAVAVSLGSLLRRRRNRA